MREKKRKDFRDVFGEDAFYNKAEQTLAAESVLKKNLTEEQKRDMSAAEDYCNTKMFGSALVEPQENQIWQYLSWWYFAAEEPLDPNDSVKNYVKQCLKACKARLKYWEEDIARFKSIIHGSLLMLSDPDLDLESHRFVTLLRAWRMLWVPTKKPTNPPSLEEVRHRLLVGLDGIYENESVLEKYMATLTSRHDLDLSEEEDEEEVGEERVATSTHGSGWIVPAIATATAVAVLGAVFYFRNKWRK